MKLLEKAEWFGHRCSTGQRGLSGLGCEEQHDRNNRSIKQTNKQTTTKKTMVTVVLVLPWASFSFSVMVVLESLVGKYFVYWWELREQRKRQVFRYFVHLSIYLVCTDYYVWLSLCMGRWWDQDAISTVLCSVLGPLTAGRIWSCCKGTRKQESWEAATRAELV